MDLGIEHDKYRLSMFRWAKKAYWYMRDCGAAVTRYQKVLTFENCKLQLPEYATAVELIVWGDLGCDCDALQTYLIANTSMLSTRIYKGENSLTNVNPWAYDFRTEDNQLIFPADFDGEKVTVRFWGYKQDCEKLLVSEHAIDAIVAYIEWKLSAQSRFKNREFRLSERAIENSEFRWKRKLAEARANMIQASVMEQQQMGEIMKNGSIFNEGYLTDYSGQIIATLI